MPVKVIGPARQRVSYSRHCGDIVVDADGPSSISNETVPILTGSAYGDGKMTKNDMMWRGAGDTQQGTDAWLDGVRLDEFHPGTGDRRQTTVRRRKKIYIKLD